MPGYLDMSNPMPMTGYLDTMEDFLKSNAIPTCKKCYGLGRLGRNLTKHTLEVCDCVRRRMEAAEVIGRLPQVPQQISSGS